MGSTSDWPVMSKTVEMLNRFQVPHEVQVLSAHRMPDELFAYAETASTRGIRAIIAGAGGAAHLPGMLAAKTTVPVLGVPIPTTHLAGADSLYSIVQMPAGIPVATVGIGNAKNAALLAARILGISDSAIAAKVEQGLQEINAEARAKGANLTIKKKTGF